MTTILKEFVTVKEKRGDVLPPTDYHSIVSGIRTIMRERGYNTLHQTYRELLDHLVDFTNPHHDHPTGFREELVARLYPVYAMMSATPVSLPQFVAQILSSPAYLELALRVLENESLYQKIHTPLGRVSSFNMLDYDPVANLNNPAFAIFDHVLANHDDFIKSGYQYPTTNRIVQTSDDLFPDITRLPLLCVPEEVGIYNLQASSQSLTIALGWDNVFASDKTLMLFSDSKSLSVILHTDQSISVRDEDQIYIRTDPVPQKFLHIQFTQGNLRVITVDETYSVEYFYQTNSPFVTVTLNVPVKPVDYASTVGLRELLFYQGTQTPRSPVDLSTPQYTASMQDSDGGSLYDPDGVLLIDYDVDVPQGQYLLVDDGNKQPFIDSDGNFMMVPS